MTTTLIVISAVLLITALFLVITSHNLDRRAGRQLREAKAYLEEADETLKRTAELHSKSPLPLNPKQIFFIDRINGVYCVVGKYLTVNGSTGPVVIKYFRDEDEDFSRRECEELLDKLNEN